MEDKVDVVKIVKATWTKERAIHALIQWHEFTCRDEPRVPWYLCENCQAM